MVVGQNISASKINIFFSGIAARLAKIGKALLFPIASLPIAAILIRIGGQLPTGTPFSNFVHDIIQAGGNTVFDNLPTIFAIGVAFGFSRDGRGEAALSAFIGMALLKFIMADNGVDLSHQIYRHTYNFHDLFGKGYDNILSNNVLTGIITGSIVAYIYNKYNDVELPSALGFFSGRRLVPVMSILFILFFGCFFAVVFPWIGWLLNKFSQSIGEATGNRYSNASIMAIYGFMNRLLIPFGLHHIPNTLFWFTMESHPDIHGSPINGDINIFLKGIPEGNTAGTFQTGFFPITMFGLPALAAAFYYTSSDSIQKKRVIAIFGSAALVSFLTGLTEPLEFAFLFASPALFIMHAVLTGVSSFVVGLFGIQLGFGFSAGFLDYILSIPKSLDIINANKSGLDAFMANPLWIWPIGVATGFSYFILGKYFINKFDLATPGRKAGRILEPSEIPVIPKQETNNRMTFQAQAFVNAVGGNKNITSYGNCNNRLLYGIKDMMMVDRIALKHAGALEVIITSKNNIQIIVGSNAEILNNEILAHSLEK